MAAHPDAYLIQKLLAATTAYWELNRGLRLRPSKTLFDRLVPRPFDLSVASTQLWFSYPVRRVRRVYPYLWLPFLFAGLVRADPRFRREWGEVEKLSARPPPPPPAGRAARAARRGGQGGDRPRRNPRLQAELALRSGPLRGLV